MLLPMSRFFNYLVENLSLNKVGHLVEVKPYGFWFEDGRLFINVAGPGSGLEVGDVEVEVRSLSRELGSIPKGSVAKLDCEGCEWALLQVPCDILSRIEDWVVEIHGVASPILWKMEKCGFRSFKVMGGGLVSIWRFTYK